MTSKPLKPCTKVGCPELTKDKYCDTHKPEEKKDKAERNRYYDKYIRNQKAKAFYNSKEWAAVREVVKSRVNNLCEHCLKNKKIVAADICDHIIPIETEEGWRLRLSVEGLQMLCLPCHNTKTAEDKKKYSKMKN